MTLRSRTMQSRKRDRAQICQRSPGWTEMLRIGQSRADGRRPRVVDRLVARRSSWSSRRASARRASVCGARLLPLLVLRRLHRQHRHRGQSGQCSGDRQRLHASEPLQAYEWREPLRSGRRFCKAQPSTAGDRLLPPRQPRRAHLLRHRRLEPLAPRRASPPPPRASRTGPRRPPPASPRRARWSRRNRAARPRARACRPDPAPASRWRSSRRRP